LRELSLGLRTRIVPGSMKNDVNAVVTGFAVLHLASAGGFVPLRRRIED